MQNSCLQLRAFKPEDQEPMLCILTDPQISQTYMLPDFESRHAAVPLFCRLSELSRNPERYVRCIALDGAVIGFLNDVQIRESSIELGYCIHPRFQGQGHMTAALTAAVKELSCLGFREVIAGAFEENAPSIRVMEKCGMTRLPETDEITYRGKTHRCVYYHLLLKRGNECDEC